MSLSDVGIYLSDGPFNSDFGIRKIHPFQCTHWVLNIQECYFDSYGCSPPRKLSKFITKRDGQCLYSVYKIQSLTGRRDFYCAT